MSDIPTEIPLEESGDRIIIRFDPGGAIELSDLTDSFAALARMYERHYRPEGEPAPRLFVTKLESGSIIAEIVPYAVLIGAVVYTMDCGIIVSDFTRRLWRGVKAFAGTEPPQPEPPSQDDALDIKTFVRPLTGKRGASLGIKHVRLEQRNGERVAIAEYTFDETELNRAAINIERSLALPAPPQEVATKRQPPLQEVMLFFEQASRAPGKVQGRTGDKAVVPAVTDKPLPVYFRQSVNDLKDKMVRGDENPLTNAFVVDVLVQYVADEPKGYIVTNLHKIIPGDDTPSS